MAFCPPEPPETSSPVTGLFFWVRLTLSRTRRATGMAWQKRDRNIMFAVNYEDGRTAYITIDPDSIRSGDHLARAVAR